MPRADLRTLELESIELGSLPAALSTATALTKLQLSYNNDLQLGLDDVAAVFALMPHLRELVAINVGSVDDQLREELLASLPELRFSCST